MNRFEAHYQGAPGWEIGGPQPAFVELAARGAIVSPVLDCGCGTGENALHLAALGHRVVGLDFVARAIEAARRKAAERKLDVAFEEGDALELGRLGRTFATVIDSGVFHVFDDAERARYVESLARVLDPGGRYFMLVFSDREPRDWGGPRRIEKEEIEAAFARGFVVESIAAARIATTFHRSGGQAWLASIAKR